MTNFGRPFRASATGQREVVPRRFNAGVVLDDMLRSRDQSGNRIDPKQFDALQELMVDIGDPVWACGRTSGALSGFDGFFLEPPFHFLLERGRNVRRIGHVIHTTESLPLIDRETRFGVPVTSPSRAIIEMARFETSDRLTLAIDSAIRDGGTTENHLHKRIAALRSKGRHGIPKLLAVIEGIEISRGGHSWLERRFLELCAGWNLPRPIAQEVLTRAKDKLVRVDFRFPGTSIVVESSAIGSIAPCPRCKATPSG